MGNEKKVQRNILLLYIIKFSKWFMLYMPFVKLYLEDNGLNDSHLFILHGIYSISTALFEIPSGYLADGWGRKNTLLLGTILGTLGFAVFASGTTLMTFIIAELILGIGQSMVSGADSAMLYDTLLDRNKERDYLKVEGRITSMGNFAEAFAAIGSGLIVVALSARWTYIGQTFIAFSGVIASLFLIRPKSHKPLQNQNLKQIVGIMRYSLKDNVPLRNNILISSAIGTSTLTMAWFAQIFYTDIDIPKYMMGWAWFAFNMVPGITSLYAYKLERRIGERSTIIFIVVGVLAGYLLLSFFNNYWGFAVIIGFYLVRGVATPVLKDYINKITPSEIRATVLSVRSLIIRLLFAGIGPFLGAMKVRYSFAMAMKMATVTFFIMILYPLFGFVLKRKTEAKVPEFKENEYI